MDIREVETDSDIDRFIRFSWKVYQGNSLWIPPIIDENKKFLSGKSRFFDHASRKLWMATEKGEPVAVAAAFCDRNMISHWKEPVGFLGYFEALEHQDQAVSDLFQEAALFLKSQGAKKIWTPINGNIANPAGLLANAFNQSPYCLMTYNPSYYHGYFQRNGFHRSKDLLAFSTDLLNGKLQRKIAFLLKRMKNSPITIRTFNRKQFEKEAVLVGRVYANTFKAHWGYAPQSDEEVYEIFDSLRIVMDPDLILFAEERGEPVGFVLAVPDYNPIIRRLNGNLNLLTALEFLRQKKHLKQARLIAIGVDEKWRGRRIAPYLVARAYQTMIDKGFVTCEYSWVFKENQSSQNVIRKFYGDDYKHYFIYEKEIA